MSSDRALDVLKGDANVDRLAEFPVVQQLWHRCQSARQLSRGDAADAARGGVAFLRELQVVAFLPQATSSGAAHPECDPQSSVVALPTTTQDAVLLIDMEAPEVQWITEEIRQSGNSSSSFKDLTVLSVEAKKMRMERLQAEFGVTSDLAVLAELSTRVLTSDFKLPSDKLNEFYRTPGCVLVLPVDDARGTTWLSPDPKTGDKRLANAEHDKPVKNPNSGGRSTGGRMSVWHIKPDFSSARFEADDFDSAFCYLPQGCSTAVGPDGSQWLVAADGCHNEVAVWDVASQQEIIRVDVGKSTMWDCSAVRLPEQGYTLCAAGPSEAIFAFALPEPGLSSINGVKVPIEQVNPDGSGSGRGNLHVSPDGAVLKCSSEGIRVFARKHDAGDIRSGEPGTVKKDLWEQIATIHMTGEVSGIVIDRESHRCSIRVKVSGDQHIGLCLLDLQSGSITKSARKR